MVGRGGLQPTSATGADEVEVAWAIVPERWGQGLATELARACVQIAFDDLELSSVIAYTRPDNLASRRVWRRPVSPTSASSPTRTASPRFSTAASRWTAIPS